MIVLGGGGGVAYALTRGSSTTTNAATTTIDTIATGTVQQTVATTGTIEPAQDEDLSFSQSGTIESVAATVGKKVVKGQVLARIDATDLTTALTTAQAAVTAAEQEVTAVASDSDTQIAAAAAALASAKTDLATAQTNLDEASVTAPFTGTIAAVSMAVGDVVGSGASAGGGGSTTSRTSTTSSSSSSTSTDTITLITTDAWTVSASVGSSDLASLRKGMQAQITPSGATQAVFGTVSSIGIVASSSSSGSATFPVDIDITGSPTGLYAGGSATVSLIVKQLQDVLTVPTLAVHTVNGQTVVYKQVNGKRVNQVVTLGDAYGAQTVVTKGLAAGDKVEIVFARPTGAGGGGTTRRRTGTTTGGGGFGTGGGGFGGTGGGGFPGGAFPGGN